LEGALPGATRCHRSHAFKNFQCCRVTQSHSVRLGGGHKNGHNPRAASSCPVIKKFKFQNFLFNGVLMVKRLNPVVLAILFLTSGISFAAEKCDLLENAPPDRLVSYLDGMVRGTVRGREMVECIVFAIKKLGNQRYEPGIPAVTRFLDFHWPLSLEERLKRQRLYYVAEQRRAESYPASTALVEIGVKSLPNVLETIKADSTLPIAREMAVVVVMQIYRSEPQNGVALLKKEADQEKDARIKRYFDFAIYKAQEWHNVKWRPRPSKGPQSTHSLLFLMASAKTEMCQGVHLVRPEKPPKVPF